MKLKVFSSSSAANGYLLYNDNESLIIEGGVPFINIKRFLNFDISRIGGGVFSHSHQ
jgi:hypothetical protein